MISLSTQNKAFIIALALCCIVSYLLEPFDEYFYYLFSVILLVSFLIVLFNQSSNNTTITSVSHYVSRNCMYGFTTSITFYYFFKCINSICLYNLLDLFIIALGLFILYLLYTLNYKSNDSNT